MNTPKCFEIITSCGINAIVFWDKEDVGWDTEQLRNLIEQDILFSEIEPVTKIFVIKKGQETEDFYTKENDLKKAISYFHSINNIEIHVRIS